MFGANMTLNTGCSLAPLCLLRFDASALEYSSTVLSVLYCTLTTRVLLMYEISCIRILAAIIVVYVFSCINKVFYFFSCMYFRVSIYIFIFYCIFRVFFVY